MKSQRNLVWELTRERFHLGFRIEAAERFTKSERFKDISKKAQDLLLAQIDAMKAYHALLEARIDLYKEEHDGEFPEW